MTLVDFVDEKALSKDWPFLLSAFDWEVSMVGTLQRLIAEALCDVWSLKAGWVNSIGMQHCLFDPYFCVCECVPLLSGLLFVQCYSAILLGLSLFVQYFPRPPLSFQCITGPGTKAKTQVIQRTPSTVLLVKCTGVNQSLSFICEFKVQSEFWPDLFFLVLFWNKAELSDVAPAFAGLITNSPCSPGSAVCVLWWYFSFDERNKLMFFELRANHLLWWCQLFSFH